MAATVMFGGLKHMQKYIFGSTSPNLYVALYDALVTGGLGVASVFADFSLNSLSGGAAIPLSAGTWVDVSVSPIVEFTYTGISWIFAPYAGGTTLYGYLVYDYTSSVALWAEDFTSPYTVPAGGGGGVLLLDKKGDYC